VQEFRRIWVQDVKRLRVQELKRLRVQEFRCPGGMLRAYFGNIDRSVER
jgi:hypothetical protein